MDHPASDRPPFPQIPGYKVLDKLGKGGMATVYLAVQESIGREIALKVMAAHLGENNLWAKRFIREAQVIAQLTHPNIVPVYDVGTHEGHFYIAMEYVKGGSLEGVKHGELSLSKILKVVAGVAAGLDYAGEKGFVHRDIKPDNVMFREDSSPVILDFGIVKQKNDVDSNMTQTGTVIGTASYMSPEQVQDQELDERSDIYSLGILLYELLTGHPPFHGSSVIATMMMHVKDPVPPLPSTLKELQPVLDKALAKSRDARYTRAREMILHLKSLESEIKHIITRQHTAMTLGSDDETMEHEVLPETQARQTKFNTSREHLVADDELTKVLSSAQATIKDFSAESRIKKAKRGKQFFALLIIATLGALSFAAYQQLYIAPKERALAQEKLQQTQEAAKRKIDELLLLAGSKRANVRPSNIDGIEKIVALYREVLTLAPNNAQAKDALEFFTELYLDSAQSAFDQEDMSSTERFLVYAQQLSPSNPKIETLRKAILQSRSRLLDEKFEQDKVKTLLDLVDTEIKSTDGFSENAYLKLQQILRLDKKNKNARKALDTMLQKTEDKIYRDLAKGNLRSAKKGIQDISNYDADNIMLSKLRSEYQKTSEKSHHDKNIAILLDKAKKLKQQTPTRSLNIELKETWLDIIALEKSNPQAKQGLIDTNKHFKDLALRALEERNVKQAQREFKSIENGTPKSNILYSLKNSISKKQQAISEANALIDESKQLHSGSQSGDLRREALLNARKKLDKADKLDKDHPDMEGALEKLESAYILSITQSIRNKDDNLVRKLFADTEDKSWPSNRILDLQLSQRKDKKDKKKPKRVISGGF